MNDRQNKAGERSPAALPLQNKTVLTTRPADQIAEFSELLRLHGANVIAFPTIAIQPPATWESCDRAIDVLVNYDAVILTSVNAVKFFFQRLDQRSGADSRESIRAKEFFAVGSKTSEALEKEGVTPVHLSGISDSRDLADALVKTPLRGKRFLFPKGSLSEGSLARALQEHGAYVDEIVVYQTVPASDQDALSVREKLEAGLIDIVTFFSPSSVQNLAAMIPIALLSAKTIAVIGSTTAAAARLAGLTVHIVAVKPTSADLVHAIVQFFSA